MAVVGHLGVEVELGKRERRHASGSLTGVFGWEEKGGESRINH